jgi:ribonucleoside-diphosphate reductase alpha chain
VTAPISHPAVADPDRMTPSTNGSKDSGGRADGTKAAVALSTVKADTGELQTASVQQALGEMMGDAPLCETCGHITVRNGSCYRCFNCGNSMGCS